MPTLSIQLTIKETKKLFKMIIGSKRKRFSAKFLSTINSKLQSNGINCLLEESCNWFKRDNSGRKKGPFWSGVYYCTKIECKTKYALKIKENFNIGDSLIINVKYTKPESSHDLIPQHNNKSQQTLLT